MFRFYPFRTIKSDSLGLLISLGIHGLILGLILPKINNEKPALINPGTEYAQNLQIVTLTSLEQSRLPDALQPNVVEILPQTLPVSPELPSFSTPQLTPLPPIPEPEEATPIPIPPPPTTTPNVVTLTPPVVNQTLTELVNPEDSLTTPQLTLIEEEQRPTENPVPSTPAERQETLITSVQGLAASLKYDPVNTTAEESQANQESWLNSLANSNIETLDWQGNYPKDACIRPLEGTVTYGIVVDEQGIVKSQQLIQSAGYGILNQAGAMAIAAHSFEREGAYLVKISYTYNEDLCPSLSLSR